MNYPIHEDDRGYFQEIARERDLRHSIKQVSIFTIKSGKTRGDHYHNKLIETFIVLEGNCMVSIFDENFTKELFMSVGDCVTIFPKKQHKFYTEVHCKMLSLASEEFNKDDPDVFKY